MKNVFEKIVDGEIPSNKVLENEKFLAFHDINPKAPIHILIIPKKVYENFQEVDPKIMGEFTSFIQEVAVKMGIDKKGYRLISNCGKNAGQEVMHLHFHMLSGENLSWEHASGSNMKDGF